MGRDIMRNEGRELKGSKAMEALKVKPSIYLALDPPLYSNSHKDPSFMHLSSSACEEEQAKRKGQLVRLEGRNRFLLPPGEGEL